MAFSLDVSNESHVCYLYGSAVLSSAFQFTSMSRSRVTTIGDWRCSFFLGMAAMKTSKRASVSRNVISSHFTILKSYFINYIISFYNIFNISKFYFFPILFKYSILFFLFLLFLFFYSFSSLTPSTSNTGFNTQNHTHTDPWYTNPPIQTHHHTHINTNYQTIN